MCASLWQRTFLRLAAQGMSPSNDKLFIWTVYLCVHESRAFSARKGRSDYGAVTFCRVSPSKLAKHTFRCS